MAEIVNIADGEKYRRTCPNCIYDGGRTGVCKKPGGWRWSKDYKRCIDFRWKVDRKEVTLTGLVFSIAAVIMAISISNSMVAECNVVSAIPAGEVVDKRIENQDRGLFTVSDMEYRIYIEAEYEFDGERKTTTKYYTVDKETYMAYHIGDWFDSRELQTADELAVAEGDRP